MSDEESYLKRFKKWGRIMGFSNTELTPELAALLGGAMGTQLDKKSVVMAGRDYRRDSRMLKRSFSGGLLGAGIELIDLHAVPTSVLQFSVRKFGADAGLMATRSHNLAGMVSIKLFDSNGIEYPVAKVEEIIKIAEQKQLRRVSSQEVGWINLADPIKIYESALAGYFADAKEPLINAGLRVVIDCACGPSALIMPDLLSEFGCSLITLNAHRPRNPAFLPNPESLVRLRETVVATHSDLGIALDAEARHAVMIDSQGRIRTAEETASVSLHSRYDPDPNLTVVAGVTVHPSVYHGLNKNIIFSKHGEPGSLARAVLENRAIYGFNDTGLFVYPLFSPGSDGMVAALTVLAQLAKQNIKSTELYRNHQIFPQRIAEVTLREEEMLHFFTKTLNNPPEDYSAIDTYIGIKLISKNNAWLHYYLGTNNHTLNIEVFDPQAREEVQTEYIQFARTLVEDFKNQLEKKL